jgi:hypothetical protein
VKDHLNRALAQDALEDQRIGRIDPLEPYALPHCSGERAKREMCPRDIHRKACLLKLDKGAEVQKSLPKP